ncbi:MAG: sigma-70 family RNA polymerase sigma factor [Cyanobacteriota bacterium]|jgi:RNA polymerase primary sigma factor
MSDMFGDYLRSIGRIPLLTAAEEVHLGTIIQRWINASPPSKEVESPGRRAMSRMVSANQRLVVSVVTRFQRRIHHLQLDPMDLVQSGNLGLIRAAAKYDPSRGYKFSTYAHWWIRQAVGHYVQENRGCIRLPAHIARLAQQAGKISDAMEPRGMTAESLQMAKALQHARTASTISLDQQFCDGSQLLDALTDGQEMQTEEDYHFLHAQLEQLQPLELTILQMRYGRENRATFAHISEKTGLSKDRIQRIERKTLAKLRERIGSSLDPC